MTRLLIAFLGTVMVLTGCRLGPEQEKAAPTVTAVALERTTYLLENFEGETLWSVESADDRAELSYVEDKKTSGNRAMRVAFRSGPKGKTSIRREVDYDFSGAKFVMLDLYNYSPDEPVEFAMSFRTYDGDRVFDTKSVSLNPGWNKDVVVQLNAEGFSPSNASSFSDWQSYNKEIMRISLLFYGRSAGGQAAVDNLRTNVPLNKVSRGSSPRLDSVLIQSRSVPQFGKFEAEVSLSIFEGKKSSGESVSVYGTFTSPSDNSCRINAYPDSVAVNDGCETQKWKIRFCPTGTGRWQFDVTVRHGKDEAVSRSMLFQCTDTEFSNGFIRVSKDDVRQFAFDSGKPFYPFGQNVCWASDYEYYFKKIWGYGGNFVRIWMCPWNLQLEKKIGRYDGGVADNFDRILELAEKYGIYVQLVFEYHGMLHGDWANNPYNKRNGGPCDLPEDFFRNSGAKSRFKKRLDYIVSRWGYSTHIFAWELFNEVDLSKYASTDDVVNWHREMSGHLKSIDLNRHLVTTSMYSWPKMGKLWELPEIDFTQSHIYAVEVYDAVNRMYQLSRAYPKPYFIGEIGRGSNAGDDQADPSGRHLHATLWLALLTPMAGNAMFWWWDTFVDAANLYGHYAAAHAFFKDEDFPPGNMRPVRKTIEIGQNNRLNVQGLASQYSAYLYLYRPDLILHPQKAADEDFLNEGLTMTLEGMLDGKYSIEYWDTYEGKVADRRETEAADGVLTVNVPPSDRDIAIKVKKDLITLPGLR